GNRPDAGNRRHPRRFAADGAARLPVRSVVSESKRAARWHDPRDVARRKTPVVKQKRRRPDQTAPQLFLGRLAKGFRCPPPIASRPSNNKTTRPTTASTFQNS